MFMCGIVLATVSGCSGGDGGEISSNGDGVATVVEAQAVIGPSGGTVEVVESDSSLYGAKVYIPVGALSHNSNISICSISSPVGMSSGYSQAGHYVYFGPEGITFNTPVSISLPYHDDDHDGFLDGTIVSEMNISVLHYDSTAGQWTELPIVSQDTDRNIVNVETTHFSVYSTAHKGICSNITFGSQRNRWIKYNQFIDHHRSAHVCENVIYTGTGPVTLKYTNNFSGDNPRSAQIQTVKKFGYGVFEGEIDIPDASGVVVAFFLYAQNSSERKWETDFEVFPGTGTFIVGTYNEFDKGMDPNEKIPGKRDKSAQIGLSVGSHKFKIVKMRDRIEFYIPSYYSGPVWTTTDTVPKNPQHVLFEIWEPEDGVFDSEAGEISSNDISMIVRDFSFTPDTDGDGVTDDDDLCSDTPEDQIVDEDGCPTFQNYCVCQFTAEAVNIQNDCSGDNLTISWQVRLTNNASCSFYIKKVESRDIYFWEEDYVENIAGTWNGNLKIDPGDTTLLSTRFSIELSGGFTDMIAGLRIGAPVYADYVDQTVGYECMNTASVPISDDVSQNYRNCN